MGDIKIEGPTAPDPPEEDEQSAKERLNFLWDVHKYINQYVGFADSRATTTLIVSTSLIGALYQTNVHEAFAAGKASHWFRVDTLASVASFICLALGIFFCILTVIPRLKKTPAAGFVYWESVLRHGTEEKFWRHLRSHSPDKLAQHLAENVYILASIATRKYALLHRGMISAFIGGMLGAAVLIFR